MCRYGRVRSNISRRDRRLEAGLYRRRRFGELLAYLTAQGLEFSVAHSELLKVLRGEDSPFLRKFKTLG